MAGPILAPSPAPAHAVEVDEKIEEVYLTLEQALKIVFPRSEEVVPQTIALTPEHRRRIEAKTGRPFAAAQVTVYVGKTKGQIDGYAMIVEEIGMYKPITSMVGVTPDGRVGEVAVMVYRESRGGDVRRKRFLNQYRGKRLSDPIRINQDIINVTGATLSVRSMNTQVRKALAVIQALYLQGNP